MQNLRVTFGEMQTQNLAACRSRDRASNAGIEKGSMKRSYIIVLFLNVGLLSGCTYEGLRMQERRDCMAMPQSLAERCFARTAMTKKEYDSERRKLESQDAGSTSKKTDEIDPRYEKWIP